MPALVAYRMFQHAAARRRLDKFYLWAVKVNSFNTQPPEGGWISNTMSVYTSACFNTQPPEGGWFFTASMRLAFSWFQHAAARRRLVAHNDVTAFHFLFQHAAARRRLV